MKTFVQFTLSVLILWALAGCNSDVFVDDFEPSVSELALDGNGDSATIRFKASGWDMMGVYSFLNDSFQYKVYDANDKLIDETEYPYIEGLGKIVRDEKNTDFIVERTSPDEVKITVGKNLLSAPFQFTITASNEYESKTIYVSISPSDRYVFHHITYSLDSFLYDGNQVEEKDRITVFNGTQSVPHMYIFFPYQDECRQVRFASNDREAFRLLEESGLTVEIPSMVDGSLIMDGAQIKYTTESQNLPLPFPDTEQKSVVIPPFADRTITLLLQYEWFETEYTLYAIHPKTGEQRIITGTLQSKTPRGCYVKSEPVNN